MNIDLVTIGEIMIRFTAPHPQVLEQAPYFEVRAAGAESNVAIVAQRMGLQTGWISRLPDNALGRRAMQVVRAHGVDCSRVIWSQNDRMGTYYIDIGHPPRRNNVLYDRANSAFANISPHDIDWDYIAQARALHLTGITPALGTSPQQIAIEAAQHAKQHDTLVSFDINYRAKLWAPAEAKAGIVPLLAHTDILRAGLQEIQIVLDVNNNAEAVARLLHEEFGIQIVIVTDDARDVIVYDGTFRQRSPIPVHPVDSIGAGDAFMAGFLAGFLTDGIDTGLDMAITLGGLKHSYTGDIPWCTREEVMDFIKQRHRALR